MPEPTYPRRHTTLPFIPQPKHKETPVVEELVQASEPTHPDSRPVERQVVHTREPRYNKIYGVGRAEDTWRFAISDYVSGTLTTVANSQVSSAVTLSTDPVFTLSRWPGAKQLFLVIRRFAICPRISLATAGNIACLYMDNIGGRTIPLGVFPSTSGANSDSEVLIPTPITDTDILAIGQLLVTLNGTSPSTGTYDWQFGFTAAYLLPELRGFERPFTEIRGEIQREPTHHHLF